MDWASLPSCSLQRSADLLSRPYDPTSLHSEPSFHTHIPISSPAPTPPQRSPTPQWTAIRSTSSLLCSASLRHPFLLRIAAHRPPLTPAPCHPRRRGRPARCPTVVLTPARSRGSTRFACGTANLVHPRLLLGRSDIHGAFGRRFLSGSSGVRTGTRGGVGSVGIGSGGRDASGESGGFARGDLGRGGLR